MNAIQRIVVGTDFGETAQHALDEAIDLAKQIGAAITLVHAYELPLYAFPDGAWLTSSETATRIAEGSRAALEAEKSRCERHGVPITPMLRVGSPWQELETVAHDTHADLMVIGTHGRRGLSRALLGSVAERILRTSKLPILVIHRPAAG